MAANKIILQKDYDGVTRKYQRCSKCGELKLLRTETGVDNFCAGRNECRECRNLYMKQVNEQRRREAGIEPRKLKKGD